MRVLLLNGFDRSGSSMIGGLLGAHPEVDYFFQPFHRTEVHATQHERWEPDCAAPATEAFLKAFLRGRLRGDFIGAHWFWKHSTSLCPHPERLNVIKDTKLHFKLRWMRARFPEVELRGIWREPRAILASLVRNGFHESWYGERDFEALRSVISAAPELRPWKPFADRDLDSASRMAVIIAARTAGMAADLRESEWIVYEELLEDADAVLGELVEGFGLAPFAFSGRIHRDYNVSGLPFAGAEHWRSVPLADEGLVDEIFAPLADLAPRALSPAGGRDAQNAVE